jgi:hypothetical protein
MVGDSGFPRRKSPGRTRAGKGFYTALEQQPVSVGAAPEALDVARYIADMTQQLEAMAIAARLDLLAYFLGMAKAESELFDRSNTADESDDADDQSAKFEFRED